jgi:hypothetical protein
VQSRYVGSRGQQRRIIPQHECSALIGGTRAEVPERYETEPLAELLPLGIPQVLLHDNADDIAPFEITESYGRKGQALGDDATLVQTAGVDHSVSGPIRK